MNIIEARGRRLDNGEWVEGYPVEKQSRIFIVPADKVTLYLIDYSYEVQPFYRVDPDTFGYSTGKRDKNGREIFGGMMVKSSTSKAIYIVDFSVDRLTWVLCPKDTPGYFCTPLAEHESRLLEIIEKDEAKP
jgi:hypothetical protein